jgi:uncharacterized membrane protein YhaH (DUF805 family)
VSSDFNPYQAPVAAGTSAAQAGPNRDLKWLLFSFEGRATRWDYWKVNLGVIAAVLLGVFLVAKIADSAAGPGLAILLVLLLPIWWIGLAISVKRWHDRGKSGWWVLIGAIPYIGSFWVFIECGCLRGSVGDNAYGADPLT